MATTTTYKDWKVGDIINICASIQEFCGTTYKYIYANDINVTESPNTCSLQYGTEAGCGLHLNNVQLTFQLVGFTGSVQSKNCAPQQIYKTIGTATTDSNGVAAITYTVTAQDLLNYQNAGSSGYQYAVMACITNPGGQTIISTQTSVVTNAITASQPPTPTPTPTPTGATHRVDCDFSVLPADVLDAIGSNITTISNSLGQHLPNSSNIRYVNSTYSNGTFSIFLNYSPALTTSLDQRLMTLTIWQTIIDWVKVVLSAILVIVGGILVFTGAGTALGVFAIMFGSASFSYAIHDLQTSEATGGTATKPALTNKDLSDAIATMANNEISGCSATVCADPTTTQDQKAFCIGKCVTNITTNLSPFMNKVAPSADHTPLTTVQTSLDACTAAYNGSSKTATNFATFKSCITGAAQSAVNQDQQNFLQKYDPGASAGEQCSPGQTWDTTQNKCVAVTAPCWIPNPLGGCMLSANTGKIIAECAVIGALGYLAFVLITKER